MKFVFEAAKLAFFAYFCGMDAKTFAAEVLTALPYSANDQQVAVVAAMSRFIMAPAHTELAFILNGYAGTGKTSLTGALVRVLESHGRKAVLLAPTGRAAKVFSANSGNHPAFTIHRKIYSHAFGAVREQSGPPVPAENKLRNAVFIVDEASMIGTADERGYSLLEDLVQYVYSGEGCRLILMGDTAQLPPVGQDSSPAMNPDTLRRMGVKVSRATLTETARQAADSGILFNATRLRKVMSKITSLPDGAPAPVPQLKVNGLPDVTVVDGEDLPEIVTGAYDRDGLDQTIFITRSNRRAAEYNAGLRASVLYREEQLTRGDLLIVARNHYFTGKKPRGVDFVANGDIVTVERVLGTEYRYGMHFADVTLSFPPPADAPDDTDPIAFDAKIMLDTIAAEYAVLPRDGWEKLYYGIMEDNERFGDLPVEQRYAQLRTDPYWNALQVKYAYAVTCHKAQGGQWANVFVDLSYIPADALGMTLYRWLYTAVTRAKSHLYLISPPEQLLK